MEESLSAGIEPIAVVGIGCRFPGGIRCPKTFWEYICQGKDGITEVPPDRWNLQAYYDADRDRIGKVYTRRGGFLDNISQFDPQFFGISPREASYIDPQQRLLLEVTWEALEDGGVVPKSLAGSRVGVFVGLFMHDYENLHCQTTEHGLHGPHSPTGMSTTVAASRISYVYDFTGPCMVVDTACSSSLVAVHLACRSIWNGESEQAVAGGVNVIIRPETTMALCKASFLSPDGCSRSFDARANGYVRSEGAGMVVLKRLSRAILDKNPVYALILGSAVNQDGRSDGLTVPSREAQERLVLDALRVAGVAPEDVHYVEAHGTGTPTGDPVEATALGNVLGRNRSEGSTCIIGSIKSNIGHTESAAGIAGLIKAALMLKHGAIPPNIHFQTPNPNIPFEQLRLRVPTSLESWPAVERKPRIAGVNSFGFGGTNAHVVLREADRPVQEDRSAPVISSCDNCSKNVFPVPFSGHTPEALEAVVRSTIELLKPGLTDEEPRRLSDIGYSAALRRQHHAHRLTVAVRSREELLEHLEAFLLQERRPGMAVGSAGRNAPRLAFVFSGMGQQWWGMGRRLFDHQPVFRESMEACDASFRAHTKEWSLLNELAAEEKRSCIHETHIAQPAIFSIQVSLAALWNSRGIRPEAITGHSLGEVAAAHVAGILSLEDAVSICFHRSRLQRLKAGLGSMLAVGLSAVELEQLLGKLSAAVSIGAMNSPASITLAGDTETLEEIASLLEKARVFARFLNVEVPYHSHFMDSVLAEYRESIGHIRPKPGGIPFVSTVNGGYARGEELSAEYWARNMREPVRFGEAIGELIRSGYNLFVEIGAHPVLAPSMKECLSYARTAGTVLPTLRRRESEDLTMLSTVGHLHALGYPIDWSRFYPDNARFIRLPPYPWQREHYWNESEASKSARMGRQIVYGGVAVSENAHPLLGARLDTATPTWSNDLDLSRLDYLQDHVVQGSVVYPGAAYIEMGLAVSREIFGELGGVIEDCEIKAPLLLPPDGQITLQCVVERNESFSIFSRSSDPRAVWVEHVHGRLARFDEPIVPGKISIEELQACFSEFMSASCCYERLKSRGLEYGPRFQCIESAWGNGKGVFGKLILNPALEKDAESYRLHPTLLDACFQLMGAIPVDGTYLPVRVDKIEVYGRAPSTCLAQASIVEQTENRIKGDIRIMDEAGNLLGLVEGLHCRYVEGTRKSEPKSIDGLLYEYRWIETAHFGELESCRNAGCLPSPESIRQEIEEELGEIVRGSGINDYYDLVEPEIKGLCRAYVLGALEGLGWTATPGASFSSEGLAAELRVQPEHLRLFDRMLEILAEDGILEKAHGKWKTLCRPEATDPQVIWAGLLLQSPAYQSEFLLTSRFGSRLKEILQGEEDPLSLLFSKQSSALHHFYYDSPLFRPYYNIIRRALSSVLKGLPQARCIRILEIGAGTGSLSSFVLPLLPDYKVEYVFTDITPVFINHAEQEFKSYDFIQYKVLDIEKDPADQGFTAHGFDLILASDVLHATADLRRTLANVKSLLAAEGLLAFVEITRPGARWLDLIFGTLKGWWLFSDTDLRPSHPALPAQEWKDLLEKEGFGEVAVISDQPSGDSFHSVILGRGPREVFLPSVSVIEKPDQSLQESTGVECGPVLLLADDLGVAETLAGILLQEGKHPVLLTKGNGLKQVGPNRFTVDPQSLEDFKKILESVCPDAARPPVVVYLWDLTAFPQDRAGKVLESGVTGACLRLLNVLQALTSRQWQKPSRLWIVTNAAQSVGGLEEISLTQAPLWGIGRVIMTEHTDLQTRQIDLSPLILPSEIGALGKEILHESDEDEIALRGDHRYVHRLVKSRGYRPLKEKEAPYEVAVDRSGGRYALSFLEKTRKKPGPGEVELKVHAVGLGSSNFPWAAGAGDELELRPEQSPGFGMVCSGSVVAVGKGVKDLGVGDEVMGLVPHSLTNYAVASAERLVGKPRGLSLEEAATVPAAFFAAFYALHRLARVQPGEKVLIHAAAGSIGLAAIQTARLAGAEALATESTPEKRDFLKSLGIGYVGDSRSTGFAREVMSHTSGEGVDIVINTLPPETIAKSLSVLRSLGGRLIELGSPRRKSSINQEFLGRGISFHSLDLDLVAKKNPDTLREILQEVARLFEDKSFSPIPHRVFAASEISRAFRSLHKGHHMGEMVIRMQDHELMPVPTLENPDVCGDATYLVTGGLGGFGLATAKWLAECGARHLVLIGRSGASTPEAQSGVEALRNLGVDVFVKRVDVTREPQVVGLLAEIRQCMPPLRGIIHAAMVLEDVSLALMTPEQMKKAINPKVLGAWHLHTHTLDRELDFFISYSSITAVVGNAQQGNYAAGNVFLEALAYYRRRRGLHGLAVCWGPLAEVGYVARHVNVQELLRYQGVTDLTPSQAWQIIRFALERNLTHVGAVSMNWETMRKHSRANSPRLSLLVKSMPHAGTCETDGIVSEIPASPEGQRQYLTEVLTRAVARVLGIAPSRINLDNPLRDLGIDSLMAVELTLEIERTTGVFLPKMALLQKGIGICGLIDMVEKGLRKHHPVIPAAPPGPVMNNGEERLNAEPGGTHKGKDLSSLDIENMSDEEVSSLLSSLMNE